MPWGPPAVIGDWFNPALPVSWLDELPCPFLYAVMEERMTQPFSIAEVKTLMLQLLRWVEETRKHKFGSTPFGAPTAHV